MEKIQKPDSNAASKLNFLFYHMDRIQESHAEISRHIESDFFNKVLQGYMNGLFERFCPFKIGDTAQIIKPFNLRPDSGWAGSIHNLGVGAKGIIKEIDFRDMKFQYAFKPYIQTWFDSDGKERECMELYLFHMSEDHLGPVRGEGK